MAIDEALKCKKTGEAKVIAFNLCDHGYFDMKAYDDHFAGKLPAYDYPAEEIDKALAGIPPLDI